LKLYEHQAKAVEIAREHSRYAFFWKPGTGKTGATLSICKDRPMRTLVVGTKLIVETAWVADGEKFGVPVTSALGTKAKRRRILEDRSHAITAINYESFRIEAEFIKGCGFERIVFDESSKLKGLKSKVTKAATEVAWSPGIKEVYLLTGTPCPNCPTEVWTQVNLLNQDIAGPSYYKFAAWFFRPTQDHHHPELLAYGSPFLYHAAFLAQLYRCPH